LARTGDEPPVMTEYELVELRHDLFTLPEELELHDARGAECLLADDTTTEA
jgi:hypothetical protein